MRRITKQKNLRVIRHRINNCLSMERNSQYFDIFILDIYGTNVLINQARVNQLEQISSIQNSNNKFYPEWTNKIWFLPKILRQTSKFSFLTRQSFVRTFNWCLLKICSSIHANPCFSEVSGVGWGSLWTMAPHWYGCVFQL